MAPINCVAVALVAAVYAPPPDVKAVKRVTDRPVEAVRFLDRDRLAWLETDDRIVSGAVRVWDLSQDRAVHTIPGARGLYRRGLALWTSKDGRSTLAFADCEPVGPSVIRTFEPGAGRAGVRVKMPAAEPGGAMVQALMPIPRSGVIAVGSLDGFIFFCKPDGGDRQADDWVPAEFFPICQLAASPDGKLLAVGIDRPTVDVWDWAARKPAYSVTGSREWGGLISLGFAPDGKQLATGTFGGPVLLWDAATGRQNAVLKGRPSAVRELAFSPDARSLAVAHDDGTLIIWDLATRTPRVRVRWDFQLRSVAFAPSGDVLAVGGASGVRVYHLGKALSPGR